MDILINGMEMPKDGSCIQIVIDDDGKVYPSVEKCILKMGSIAKAVPVPPHGRCVDADALKDKWTHKDLDLFSQGWGWLRDLNQAQTVIPAEPSEEQREYEAAVEAAQYCEMYEPTYDPETGAM